MCKVWARQGRYDPEQGDDRDRIGRLFVLGFGGGAVATIADTPQAEVPTPIRIARRSGSLNHLFRRPVRNSAVNTHANTTGRPLSPGRNTSRTLKRMPCSMMPRRRASLTAKVKPGRRRSGNCTRSLTPEPSRMAVVKAGSGDFSYPSTRLPTCPANHPLTRSRTAEAMMPRSSRWSRDARPQKTPLHGTRGASNRPPTDWLMKIRPWSQTSPTLRSVDLRYSLCSSSYEHTGRIFL